MPVYFKSIVMSSYIKNGCSVRLVIIRLPVQKNDVGHVQFGKVEAMVARPVPGFGNLIFYLWNGMVDFFNGMVENGMIMNAMIND